MKGFHCTRYAGEIDLLRPTRLDSVYLFEDLADAVKFLKEFGYDHIVEVEFDSSDVLRRWRASYGGVTRLKPGRTCRVLEEF